MIVAFGLAILLSIISIFKNRKREYGKQAAFAMLMFAIINCLTLLSSGEDGMGNIIYMGLFEVSFDTRDAMYNGSIVIALIGLISYLMSDIRR